MHRKPAHVWGKGAAPGPLIPFLELHPEEPRGARPPQPLPHLVRRRALEQEILNLLCNASEAAVFAEEMRNGLGEGPELHLSRHLRPFLDGDPRRRHLGQQRALLEVGPLHPVCGLQVPFRAAEARGCLMVVGHKVGVEALLLGGAGRGGGGEGAEVLRDDHDLELIPRERHGAAVVEDDLELVGAQDVTDGALAVLALAIACVDAIQHDRAVQVVILEPLHDRLSI